VAAATFPGLGSADLAPLLSPHFDHADSGLTPEHYFVLTRVDGKTPLKQIVLISGFGEARALEILRKLREEGAIYFPGEAPPPKKVKRRMPTTRPGGAIQIDEKLLDEPGDLSREQKRAILVKQVAIRGANLFEVLEVDPDADKRALKRAYFKISKDFHPDRYYGKNLGSFKARLDEVFAVATRAFEELEDDDRRAQYLATLEEQAHAADPSSPAPQKPTTVPPAGASPSAQAAELFEHACQHQVTGEVKQALREFAQAIRLDPQPRYLRRAAEAALRAQELRSAEEYAKKAAELDSRDASAHRMLAKVFRATGRKPEARRELEIASKLDPNNSFIAAELDELNRQA
jgi:tetratricopeptide (TPR) repeat protein